MVEGLRQRGVRVTVIELQPSHVLFKNIPSFSSMGRPNATTSMFQRMEQNSIVIVDGMAILEVHDLLSAHARNTKRNLTFIGLIHYPFSQEVDAKQKLKKLCLKQETSAFRSCTSFIAASSVTKRLLVDVYHISPHIIHVVRPAISLPFFRQLKRLQKQKVRFVTGLWCIHLACLSFFGMTLHASLFVYCCLIILWFDSLRLYCYYSY